ncbi:hypothetical protein Goshw_004552 [Gossypium schwendimanii]|uniref:Uncharacterized protein n=1 Tax=Gossypium schwendimanii TaxID=34291 RepID=A0A7J9M9P2_GOSSC|nr:hypothetical protein [Gossypium schwendimanii]
MGLPVDTIKARLKDKNDHCISWSNIRDVIGKAGGDRHLALFAFAVYKLIVLPKSLGYVSVELADFLYDQCVPTTACLNRVEALVQDLGFWKKLKRYESSGVKP